MKRSPTPSPSPGLPRSAERLLDGVLVFFLTLAVTLRPLLPSHRDEANLWVEMGVFIAALAWLMRMAMTRRLRLVPTGLGLPTLALLAIAAVSVFRSPHPIESLATWLEWLCYAAVFFVIVNVVGEGGLDRRFLLRLLWASAFVACLYGLFQQFVNMPLLQAQIQADGERVLAELRMSSRHLGDLMARATGRIFSTFLLSNSFAGFLALVIPGFVGHVLDRLRAGERGRLFPGASALWLVAALACLLLTYSKGGWAAFAVGSGAFVLMMGRNVLRRHARPIAGAVAAGAAVFGLLLVLRVVPVQIFRDAIPSLDVREGYWRGALAMARDYPLGGVGLGTFGVHFPRYRPLLAHPAQEAHNDYLQVLAELGVPGLVAFLLLWAAYLRNVFGRRDPTPGPSSSSAPQHLPPNTQHLSSCRFPLRTAIAAAVVAFLLTTVVADTFSLAGWWDTGPASLELKVWLDRALAVGLAVCWVAFFLVLGRGGPAPLGELCRKGLVCGVIAFLVHCAVDFDYQEPGVAFSAWVVMALSVAPRREAVECRLSRSWAVVLGCGALLAMAAFQLVLWCGTRSATERDIAANLVSEAVRNPSDERRFQQIHDATRHYEAALGLNPLDDALRVEYADLLVSLLVPPDPSGRVRPDERAPGSPALHVRIETPDDARLFRRAVELYQRAAELNRTWALPHVRLGGLYTAAGRPAVAEYEAALELDPNNPSLLLLLSEALEGYGDPRAAEKARLALDIGGRIAGADPGHKMCLRDEERLRAEALVRRSESKGAPP